ncbi:hypothetical protein JG687_00005458 [Phytophthora cactorum]|uniref:Uncharacterized protein n=1 Tax=Phytophthora cactorum TaxID=29920 RepID=A0A329RD18_9STRA|nr:hypothetical protein Pcac1_g622 [Phytophthora cactorum]KAG2794892.1 hypothetical protein PC111_g22389 [Phytophthora cactorum]KAG2795209.1 hypothetical protein PC112_g22727 [Phytophthora cactorum]KAG2820411.1 hypothetical protein PC113_g22600 [Phytophthora cactorum]KAG2874334.1 hypothetical protein PC114_g25337 [Phytophthora cactorum]
MVLRFSEDNDKELMKEVILHKPVATQYGEPGGVWMRGAERVSAAIKVAAVNKQAQDRVMLHKKNRKAVELRSALASGIEEARDSKNVQSHYETLAGLVGQYIGLEDAFIKARKLKKVAKEAEDANSNSCASQISAGAITRRALRGATLALSESSSSEGEDDSSSETSTLSIIAGVTPTN